MSFEQKSTIESFSLDNTDDNTNDIQYSASWEGGYPPYQYELRERESLKTVDSGNTKEQFVEGVVSEPDTDKYTIRVTDAGGDVISSTTVHVS